MRDETLRLITPKDIGYRERRGHRDRFSKCLTGGSKLDCIYKKYSLCPLCALWLTSDSEDSVVGAQEQLASRRGR